MNEFLQLLLLAFIILAILNYIYICFGAIIASFGIHAKLGLCCTSKEELKQQCRDLLGSKKRDLCLILDKNASRFFTYNMTCVLYVNAIERTSFTIPFYKTFGGKYYMSNKHIQEAKDLFDITRAIYEL